MQSEYNSNYRRVIIDKNTTVRSVILNIDYVAIIKLDVSHIPSSHSLQLQVSVTHLGAEDA